MAKSPDAVSPNASDYKQKLRNHSTSSSTSTSLENKSPSIDVVNSADSSTEPQQNQEQEQGLRENTEHSNPSSPLSSSKQPGKQLVEIPVINMEDFEVVDTNDKLNLLMAAINKINTNFHYKFDALKKDISDDTKGIMPHLKKLEKQQEELQARMDDWESNIPVVTDLRQRIQDLEAQNCKLQDDVETLKGYIQVQEKAINSNQKKITDLTSRSMANNVVITGLLKDSKDENCKEKVLTFLRTQLNMTISDSDVVVAHRMGKQQQGEGGTQSRPMVVRCSLELRRTIFNHTSRLKNITNDNNQPFYVKPQLPEPLLSEKKEREDKLRSIRKANDLLPENQKKTAAHIKNNTLYINDVPQKKHIFPPTAQDVFNIDRETRQKMDKIHISHSGVISEKKSTFCGHAVHVRNATDVKLAYLKMKAMYLECDHIMMGYTFKTFSGNADNGEFGASSKILNIIQNRGLRDTAVFMTREFGGIQLGTQTIHVNRKGGQRSHGRTTVENLKEHFQNHCDFHGQITI